MKAVVLSLVFALGVGFYTLAERKVLSYCQRRKGPNKATAAGVTQPLADALKLFAKQGNKVHVSFYSLYFLLPLVLLCLNFCMTLFYRTYLSSVYLSWGVLFFICLSRLSVYGVLGSGWASNSKYSFFGSLRALAQTISYEVCFSLILLAALFCYKRGDFLSFASPIFLLAPVLGFILAFCVVAETNRAPFDHAEAERELVRGFNTEYGGAPFSFLFIAEYRRVIVISIVFSCVFWRGGHIMVLLCMFFFLWLRASLPRLRYDSLMQVAWKSVLSAVLICSPIYFIFV